MDLTFPRCSSNIRVHQRKESEGFRSVDGVVCLGKSEPLVHVSGTLADLNYRIWRARIEYPRAYKFLMGRLSKCDDFDIGSSGNEEMGNMKRIVDVAIERGCSEINVGLSVRGPSEELHDDLMTSLRENGLFVTGGQFYRDYDKLNSCLHFFVTEIPASGTG